MASEPATFSASQRETPATANRDGGFDTEWRVV